MGCPAGGWLYQKLWALLQWLALPAEWTGQHWSPSAELSAYKPDTRHNIPHTGKYGCIFISSSCFLFLSLFFNEWGSVWKLADTPGCLCVNDCFYGLMCNLLLTRHGSLQEEEVLMKLDLPALTAVVRRCCITGFSRCITSDLSWGCLWKVNIVVNTGVMI